MTPSQITRAINWIAVPVALVTLGLVAMYIYQRHMVQPVDSARYQFDDLPTLETRTVSADIDAIVRQHVFGQQPRAPEASAKPAAQKPAPKPAPKTRLNLKLTGIIDGSSPENGIAILEVERGKTLVVAVGEKIGDTDAVLHQVLPGEVLIDRNGSIESVKMERNTLSVASLDPALSTNLPQPYAEGANTASYGSAEPPATPLPEASQNYADSGNSSDAQESGVLVSYPRGGGMLKNQEDDEEDPNRDDGRDDDGDRSESRGRLPIPRPLRN